jgi:hypothetical protein
MSSRPYVLIAVDDSLRVLNDVRIVRDGLATGGDDFRDDVVGR